MSQFGMQMPGSQLAARRPSMNVYTGLMFVAVVVLAAACALMWRSASLVSPQKGAMAPFALQEAGRISVQR